MTLVQLTEITHGDARPFAVNPDHVASLRPRKTIIPIDAQQDPRGQISYNGTILVLATGEQHFVTEDFDTVAELMATPTPEFTDQLKGRGVPISNEPTPAPIKKSHHKQPEKQPEKPAQDPEPSSSPTSRTSCSLPRPPPPSESAAMSKPKAAPAGIRARRAKHAIVVENTDFTELFSAAPPTNRKQRRAAAKHQPTPTQSAQDPGW